MERQRPVETSVLELLSEHGILNKLANTSNFYKINLNWWQRTWPKNLNLYTQHPIYNGVAARGGRNGIQTTDAASKTAVGFMALRKTLRVKKYDIWSVSQAFVRPSVSFAACARVKRKRKKSRRRRKKRRRKKRKKKKRRRSRKKKRKKKKKRKRRKRKSRERKNVIVT